MTTNEIAEQNDSSLELLPRAQAPSSAAQAMLLVHAEMMQTAFQLASKMCRTSVVPRRYFGKADDATAAILYGAELGLNPIQSLQKVVAIHGMPSLESRTMVGLLKAKGFRVRTTAQSDTSVTVEGVAPDGEMASSTWTIDRAKRAGYVPTPSSPDSLCRPDVDDDWVTVTKTWDGKPKKSVVGNMKYITDPQTMLKAKAQAEVCRELAPDVLMGISYTSEELESEDQRQFDERDDNRGESAGARRPVEADEILAEEVPLDDGPIPEPAGPTAEQIAAQRKQAETDAKAAAASKRIAAKRSTAPAANPDKPKGRMRKALEKRLFGLLGEVGLADEKNRDGRIAVYRSVLEDEAIGSTDDLDDTAIGKVADKLYAWSEQGVLGDEVAGILSDAALAESTAAAPADASTTEGNN